MALSVAFLENPAEPGLVTGGDDGLIKMWAIKSAMKGEPVLCQGYPIPPLTAGDLLRKSDQASRKTIDAHPMSVSALVFSHDGRRLASASWEPGVKLWMAAGEEHDEVVDWLGSGMLCNGRIVSQSDAMVNDVAWSPEDRYLAVASDSNTTLWDVSLGGKLIVLIATLAAHAGPVNSCLFREGDAEGSQPMILVTGSSDHSVKLWDCSEEGRRKGMDRSGVHGHPQRVTPRRTRLSMLHHDSIIINGAREESTTRGGSGPGESPPGSRRSTRRCPGATAVCCSFNFVPVCWGAGSAATRAIRLTIRITITVRYKHSPLCGT